MMETGLHWTRTHCVRMDHGGSPNVVAVQDVCHAPREVTGMHTCGFYPVTDFHHPSKTVLVWGSNPTHTHEEGEISSLFLDQLKQGTRLIVIDPRKTDPAKRAQLWLQPRQEDIGEKENWTRSNFNMLTSTHDLGREFGTPNLKGIGCRISLALL